MKKRLKRILNLILIICMFTNCFPCMENVKTEERKVEVANIENEEEIVRGYSGRIKHKKQNKVKVKINEDENGKVWNKKMIHAENVVESEQTIKIAIIDSGINFSTDLNVVVRKNFIEGDERNVLYEDPSGHGTAIAGIIGALENEEGITGINPGVELYSARVLDERLEAPIERIVAAIDWAIEQDVDIINMSFGITKNVKQLEAAIERAADAGILLIGAAGNEAEIAYPAAYEGVIAVGSITSIGTPAEDSAQGEELELMAPGENILSSAIFGGVIGVSGTSMAAPHVVGAASVVMEMNPEMPTEYIRALLNYSANLYGSSEEYGNGVIDLEYAIEINEKFKKLYKKNSTKKAKKDNREEIFWTDVVRTIPENEKEIEIFTELDIVEGMWGTDDHEILVQDGIIGTQMSFTQEQMAILTYACNYPDVDDKLSGMNKNPYHGFFQQGEDENGNPLSQPLESNYVANYIFLTKVANYYGNAAGVTYDKINQNDRVRIVNDISTTRLGNKTWKEVFERVSAGRKISISATLENKKLFIYGMAIHSVADILAHSTWANQGSEGWSRVRHKKNYSQNADNPNYLPLRFTAARTLVRSVLTKAYSGSEGTVTDFLLPSGYFGTFYLRNLSEYVESVDSVRYNNLKSGFDALDLDSNVQNYNTSH